MNESILNKTILVTKLPNVPTAASTLPFNTIAVELRANRYHIETLNPGDRIGRYVVGELVGTGGFSLIHSARHIYLNYQVALKTLKNAERIGTEMFLREAQALAILGHTNVVRVIDADICNGVPFLVMELLMGEDLITVLNKYQRLSIERTMDLMEELGDVLAKQEEKGILHLDIKPGNIFQRADDITPVARLKTWGGYMA